VFLTAGEAWLRCRAGDDDPDRFGNGGVKGVWFIGVDVVRDALSIRNRETSAWDRWREAPSEARTVSRQERETLDELARAPAEAPVTLLPPWLRTVADRAREVRAS